MISEKVALGNLSSRNVLSPISNYWIDANHQCGHKGAAPGWISACLHCWAAGNHSDLSVLPLWAGTGEATGQGSSRHRRALTELAPHRQGNLEPIPPGCCSASGHSQTTAGKPSLKNTGKYTETPRTSNPLKSSGKMIKWKSKNLAEF